MHNKTIITCKVYEMLDLNSRERVIGWWTSLELALEGLVNFGDECRWNYAIFEEFDEGLHPQTIQKMWMKFDNETFVWKPYHSENSEENVFMSCINHAIG